MRDIHHFIGGAGAPVGKTMLVHPWIGCGECAACKRGEEQMCSKQVATYGGKDHSGRAAHPGSKVTLGGYAWIIIALVVGGSIGLFAAKKVQMTQMPELVALMHSLVGLAACLVGFASYVDTSTVFATSAEKSIHEVEIYLGILIGAVTFSGSIVAFGKLSGKIGGNPLLLPGRHWLNLAGLLIVVWFGREFLNAHSIADRHALVIPPCRGRVRCGGGAGRDREPKVRHLHRQVALEQQVGGLEVPVDDGVRAQRVEVPRCRAALARRRRAQCVVALHGAGARVRVRQIHHIDASSTMC